MRQVQLRVDDESLAPVTARLEELDVEYLVTAGSGPTDGAYVVEFPVPADAVDEVLTALHEAGLSQDAYLVIGSAEAVATETSDRLLDRYAADFDPLTRLELRSKARDQSRDRFSYVAMIFLSAVIATAGLLVGSPAVVVGSMVIAPFVGPILTAGVGTLTGDREMLVDSLLYQGGGMLVAVVAATLTAAFVRWTGFVPPTLAVFSTESLTTRLAPGLLSVLVGFVSGGAAAFGLSTKGPTALIGVMIAAALVPTAGAIGIAVVWAAPIALVGTTALLIATVVAINVGVLLVLWWLGYRPEEPLRNTIVPESGASGRGRLVAVAVVTVLAVGLTSWAVVGHVTFERDSAQAIDRALEEPRYDALEVRSVTQEYSGPATTAQSRTVTVVLSRPAGTGPFPDLPGVLAARIEASTGQDVTVEVRYQTYHRAERASELTRPAPRTTARAAPARAAG